MKHYKRKTPHYYLCMICFELAQQNTELRVTYCHLQQDLLNTVLEDLGLSH